MASDLPQPEGKPMFIMTDVSVDALVVGLYDDLGQGYELVSLETKIFDQDHGKLKMYEREVLTFAYPMDKWEDRTRGNGMIRVTSEEQAAFERGEPLPIRATIPPRRGSMMDPFDPNLEVPIFIYPRNAVLRTLPGQEGASPSAPRRDD